jgi:hypothetical protein
LKAPPRDAVDGGAIDPAARAAVRLRPLDRATFDILRIAVALRTAGFDADAVERTRLALELAHPRTIADASARAAAWLADPDVRAFLQVHEWDGVEWLVRDRWLALVALADALDRESGAKHSAPAIARLRSAVATGGDRVDAIVAALTVPDKGRQPPPARTVRSGTKPPRPKKAKT